MAMAMAPPPRRCLNTSRIAAAPMRRAVCGSPCSIVSMSIGMTLTPSAPRAPAMASKSFCGRSCSASRASRPPPPFHAARPVSQAPKCIDTTTTPLPRASASV